MMTSKEKNVIKLNSDEFGYLLGMQKVYLSTKNYQLKQLSFNLKYY